MNRKTLCALLGSSLLLSASLCGCGTMDNMRGVHGEPRVYGGMRQDMKDVAHGNPAAALDVPFSAVGDTVTLPVTVGRKLTQSR